MADQDTRLNAYWGRPVVALLDALHSTPVGLTAININLSKGSQAMAASGVIVRRLTAIENFGSMDVLCTDKTGTLTEGVVRLDAAVDARGAPSDEVLRFAYLNAAFQTGLVNPLDEAIIARAGQAGLGTEPYTKVDEIPYDFIRKRLSVVVGQENGRSDAALPLSLIHI